MEEKQKIKDKLEQTKNYILEELDALRASNFEKALRFYEGYDFFEDETEKQEIRQQEIKRREAWLNNTAPIARLVCPGDDSFDHYQFRDVLDVKGLKYNFVDLYLDGSALFERAYTSGYFYEEDAWEFFKEL